MCVSWETKMKKKPRRECIINLWKRSINLDAGKMRSGWGEWNISEERFQHPINIFKHCFSASFVLMCLVVAHLPHFFVCAVCMRRFGSVETMSTELLLSSFCSFTLGYLKHLFCIFGPFSFRLCLVIRKDLHFSEWAKDAISREQRNTNTQINNN